MNTHRGILTLIIQIQSHKKVTQNNAYKKYLDTTYIVNVKRNRSNEFGSTVHKYYRSLKDPIYIESVLEHNIHQGPLLVLYPQNT